MSESGTETVFVYLMFLFGHVDFIVMFLKEPLFPFYKTGHKSVEVFERGAKNLLLKLWQNISREKEKKRKKRNQWKYLSKESSSQVLAKHFKILRVHSFSLSLCRNQLNKWIISSDQFSSSLPDFYMSKVKKNFFGEDLEEIQKISRKTPIPYI